jgi:hypothetical protein
MSGFSFTKRSNGEYKTFDFGTGFNLQLNTKGSIDLTRNSDSTNTSDK